MTPDNPRRPNDPWRADAARAAFAAPGGTRYLPAEELASDGDPASQVGVPRQRRRLVFASVGVVVALLAGVGAYAGVSAWYGWSTTQPESVLPGTVSAFARIDFSPGLGQRLRIANLAKKFPRAAASQDAIAQLRRDLVDGLGLSPLDYETDIRPWFGDRIGVAAWSPASAAASCTLVAIASTDDAAAGTALKKVQKARGSKAFGYGFDQGYAVYATCPDVDSQSASAKALAQARTQTLDDHAAFADEVSALPAGQTALGWADLSQALPVGLNALGVKAGAAKVTGIAVVGLQATADGLDLRYRVRADGNRSAATTRDVAADLGALPGGTVIGVCADLGGLGSATTNDLLPATGLGAPASSGVAGLLQSAFSLSVTDVTPSSMALRLVARTPNADAAAAIELVLRGPLLADALPGALVNRAGNTVTYTGGTYRAGAGTLADRPAFRTAMDGGPRRPVLAAYVDVQTFAAAQHLKPADAANLAPVKAIGFSTGYDGDALVGLLRVVIQ